MHECPVFLQSMLMVTTTIGSRLLW